MKILLNNFKETPYFHDIHIGSCFSFPDRNIANNIFLKCFGALDWINAVNLASGELCYCKDSDEVFEEDCALKELWWTMNEKEKYYREVLNIPQNLADVTSKSKEETE